MTREEAIKIIDCYDIGFYDLSGEKIPADKLADAFDMAIESLSAEYDDYEHATLVDIKEPLKVAVVRCKDCRWYSVKGKTTMYGWCDANWISVNETDYCSKGERKGGDAE